MSLTMPPALVPGDTALVVAPSSSFAREALWQGLAWIRARYRIRMSASVLSREAYLAGSDVRRRAELAAAIADTSAKAILVARGGYGAMRILDGIPWDECLRQPKWIVGFSDATALHAMAWRAGMASIHGPNVTGVGQIATPVVRAAWLSCLEDAGHARQWSNLRVLCGGRANGVMVGGNLALLHALAAAGRLWIPLGAVLVLEDVGERPYRVDRMLTSLLMGGTLARAAAIVFGGFERCAAGEDGRTVDEVIEERTRTLGIPVVAGAPFGHGAKNEAFVLGAPVEVDGDTVRMGVRSPLGRVTSEGVGAQFVLPPR